MKDASHPKWEKVSAALRSSGAAQRPDAEELGAPRGFAARVVARQLADHRAEAEGLALWRRWTLAGAACALLVCGSSFLVKPASLPPRPILPVPELETFEL